MPRCCDVPNHAIVDELRFKPLTNRGLDIEESEDTSNIKEEGSQGEWLSGADPVEKIPHRWFQYRMAQKMRRLQS